jgi:hypothetical protein
MTWGKYAKGIEVSAKAAGHETPESAKAPELSATGLFFWVAYTSLNTCRYFESGPIPWCEIVNYAHVQGLNDSETEELTYYVVRLDHRYMEMQAEKMKK